jgi:F0F1-type ATP synthase assembly protein I
MPDDRNPDARELGIYFTLAQVGVEMVVPLILGLVVDYYASTSPWAMIAGMILGFVGGLWHIVLLTNKQEAARQQKGKSGSDSP